MILPKGRKADEIVDFVTFDVTFPESLPHVHAHHAITTTPLGHYHHHHDLDEPSELFRSASRSFAGDRRTSRSSVTTSASAHHRHHHLHNRDRLYTFDESAPSEAAPGAPLAPPSCWHSELLSKSVQLTLDFKSRMTLQWGSVEGVLAARRDQTRGLVS